MRTRVVAFSASQLSTLAVVTVPTVHCELCTLERCRASFVQQDHAHLRTKHVLYTKFAMKLSATVMPRWERVVAKKHTYRDFELKLIYNVYTVFASKPPIQPV